MIIHFAQLVEVAEFIVFEQTERPFLNLNKVVVDDETRQRIIHFAQLPAEWSGWCNPCYVLSRNKVTGSLERTPMVDKERLPSRARKLMATMILLSTRERMQKYKWRACIGTGGRVRRKGKRRKLGPIMWQNAMGHAHT